ncbi:MAG: CDP-glycerol glycerophosphotransferase family protein [Solirubrobacteraceae bacterium]
MRRPTRILFTGYAHVHYACFRPLHERLRQWPDVEVRVSGGLRSRGADGAHRYDATAMYAPFGVPEEEILSQEEIDSRHFDVLFASNTKKIVPRSYEHSVEIFHGLSFRNRAIRRQNGASDACFVLGPYMRRALEQHGVLGEDDPRAVPIGFMKTDRLLDGSLDREAILRAEGLSGERPVVLYAPTGAPYNSLETWGMVFLERLRVLDAVDILVKPHDHPKNLVDWRAGLSVLEGEHLRVVRSTDVVESMFVADLLVSDASSVSNEFALLDRPMVFLDVPALIAASAGNGSALDLETWGRRAGVVARDPDEAVRAVIGGLEHPERRGDVRRALAADLFYNPGTATGAAEAWLKADGLSA